MEDAFEWPVIGGKFAGRGLGFFGQPWMMGREVVEELLGSVQIAHTQVLENILSEKQVGLRRISKVGLKLDDHLGKRDAIERVQEVVAGLGVEFLFKKKKWTK